MLLFFILVVLLVYLIYKWGTNNFDYFEKRGIVHKKPKFLVGTAENVLTGKLAFPDLIQSMYATFPNEKITGNFEFLRPTLLVKDPDLIKKLTIKDFDYFQDRRKFWDPEVEPLIARALVGLTGQDWRDMRATLSPAFTGNKMRKMFELISDVGNQSMATLKKEIGASGKELEMRDFLAKYSVDVIATCAFGLQVDSFKNPDNEFQKIAKTAINFSAPSKALKLMGHFAFPKIMKFFNVKVLDQEFVEFFKRTIIDVMNEREKKGIIRHDLINLLMEARKGQLVHSQEDEKSEGFATVEESEIGRSKVNRSWTDLDLTAQAFLFFLGGYDTVTHAMSYTAYELGVNPEIQDKLIQEIDKLRTSLGQQNVTYDQIRDLKYLDQVISEVLRKWPPAPMIDRQCVKNYHLEYDDKSIVIEKGMIFSIPIFALHRDPKYFPEPEKFDPERFSDENKGKINPDTYLPFGTGPRNCIGSRFALMELKTIFYYILSNFHLEVCEKTQIPLKFAKNQFTIQSEKGIWLNFRPRF